MLCLVTLFAAFIGSVDSESTIPRIVAVGETYKLVMPDAMWAALERHAPGFAPFRHEDYAQFLLPFLKPSPGKTAKWSYEITERQVPFAVIGDFNGDNALDVVVNGCSPTRCGPIAVFSRGKGYVAVDLRPGSKQDEGFQPPIDGLREDVLVLVKAGVVRSSGWEPKPLRLKMDAVQEFYWGKGSAIYYYADGVFKRYTTGD